MILWFSFSHLLPHLSCVKNLAFISEYMWQKCFCCHLICIYLAVHRKYFIIFVVIFCLWFLVPVLSALLFSSSIVEKDGWFILSYFYIHIFYNSFFFVVFVQGLTDSRGSFFHHHTAQWALLHWWLDACISSFLWSMFFYRFSNILTHDVCWRIKHS